MSDPNDKNKFGYPIFRSEKPSSTKMQSRVAFKRPLSAAERVARAIKDHEYLRSLDSRPGDDTFDSPDITDKAIHQLMTDPISGEEVTAGEYVMLQNERAQADKLVMDHVQKEKAKIEQSFRRKKLVSKKDEDDSADDAD